MFDAKLTAAGSSFTVTRLEGFERSSDRTGSLKAGGLWAAAGFAPGGTDLAEIGADGHEPFFHLAVDILISDLDSDYTAQLVDTQASVEISCDANGTPVTRVFTGHIFRCALTHLGNPGHERPANIYRVDLYPWVWYLTYSRRNRHWVNATPSTILTEICAAYGFSPNQHWRFETGGDTALPYVVQHQQSDFDFLMELLKRLHLICYVKHDATGEMLVIGDGGSAEFWGDAVTLGFSSQHVGSSAAVVTAISVEQKTGPTVAKVANRRRALATTSSFGVVGASSPGQPASGTISGGKLVFRYPAPLTAQGEAESEADADLKQLEAVNRLFTAESRYLPLVLGERVTFTHPYDRTGAVDGKGGVVKRLIHRLDKDAYAAWFEAVPLE